MNKVKGYLSKFVFCCFCCCTFVIFSLFAISRQGFDASFIFKASIANLSDLDISTKNPFHSNNQNFIALLEVCENSESDWDNDEKEPSIDLHGKLSVSECVSNLDAFILSRYFNAEGARPFYIHPISLVVLYHSWKSFLFSKI